MRDLSNLKVCFVAGTLGQGGSERQLFYSVRALRQAGATPRVLCLTGGEFWEDRIRELGVPVTFVGERPSRLARLIRIVADLRRQPADVIQSQHFYTNLYVAAAARVLGLAEIGAVRSDGEMEIRANGRLAGRLSLWAPRVVAVNSRNAIRNAISMGISAAKLYFLPNVVDTEEFRPGPRQESGGVRLLAVGRLDKNKRFERFLEVVARLREKSRVPLHAVILGTGPEESRLRQQAERLGLLGGIVEFRGSAACMADVYRQADMLVLTSEREGTPNVLLEAMASGLAVVATAVGGVPEIVRDGETGFLVDPDSSEQMVESLWKLAEDPRLRRACGDRAREMVLAKYSIHRLPESLKALYEAAVS